MLNIKSLLNVSSRRTNVKRKFGLPRTSLLRLWSKLLLRHCSPRSSLSLLPMRSFLRIFFFFIPSSCFLFHVTIATATLQLHWEFKDVHIWFLSQELSGDATADRLLVVWGPGVPSRVQLHLQPPGAETRIGRLVNGWMDVLSKGCYCNDGLASDLHMWSGCVPLGPAYCCRLVPVCSKVVCSALRSKQTQLKCGKVKKTLSATNSSVYSGVIMGWMINPTNGEMRESTTGAPRFLHPLLKSRFRRSSSFVGLKVEIKDGDDQAFLFPANIVFKAPFAAE